MSTSMTTIDADRPTISVFDALQKMEKLVKSGKIDQVSAACIPAILDFCYFNLPQPATRG